jgi:hypothetical protein
MTNKKHREMTMNMKRIALRGLMMLLVGFVTLMIGAGCTNQSPLSIGEDSMSIPPPPMTEANVAAGPALGYQYLPIDASALFNGMTVETSMFTQQWVRQGVGGSVYFPDPRGMGAMTWWHGVTIPAAALREDVLVGVLVPDTRFVVVDYSPSPYQFEANIQIELSYRCASLIQLGVSPEQLVIMYWDESTGAYEIIPSVLNTNTMKLLGTTNHFSRYIIAAGGGN